MISLIKILITLSMLTEFTTPTPIKISNNYPTVLLHGVLANKNNMNELKQLLELNFRIKVYNLEIGNGAITSLYTPMNKQLDMLCDTIYSMDELKNGFNFIGMSQGGLLARGYVEYCNKYPVNNLITLVSPNGGVYYHNDIAKNFYEPDKQEDMSITNYWRDPYRYDIYLTNSTYLPQLNNEIPLKTNQNNLDVVNNFIMIWSPLDEVIEPPESGKLSLFEIIDNNIILVNLFDSQLYKKDSLKLKTMNEEKRLYIFETDCMHSQHREPECFHKLKNIFEEFLL